MEMIKFNEQEKIDSVNGALALRPQINEIVDEICERGYSNICWLGVGGTWVHPKRRSSTSSTKKRKKNFSNCKRQNRMLRPFSGRKSRRSRRDKGVCI